jgi:elongation factor P
VQINKFNGNPIGLQLPPIVEMSIAETELASRGDTASGSVTKVARTETGLEIRVPLFNTELRKAAGGRRYRPIADLARAPERTSLNHFKADA